MSVSEAIAPAMLTTRQAAELLQVGERTLWRWSHSGRAPKPVKFGDGPKAAVRYRRADLEKWIADGCPRVDGGEQ